MQQTYRKFQGLQNSKSSFSNPNNQQTLYIIIYLVLLAAAATTWYILPTTTLPPPTSAATTTLRRRYYSATCPSAESTVAQIMKQSLLAEPRSAASVLRLQFHDCFVNGCDGSLLLDDTPTMAGEKLALANINSLRSFEVIDKIKAELEQSCPGVVSCADIVIMAARDAVSLTGGPRWEVKLGRLDGLTASRADSDAVMPSPRANATTLIDLFAKLNLSVKDLVALSGSHSIGRARCFSITHRLYDDQAGARQPEAAIEPGFREKLMQLCPVNGYQNVTGGLDSTPVVFDNLYFKDLVVGKGVLNSDQTLYTSPETRAYVEEFSRDEEAFFQAFAEGMIKLGDLQSGQPGEVRRNCRAVNGSPAAAMNNYQN
ncbi:unnamed protein product [Linum trigynum]